MPERKIDGNDIRPLISGTENAKSPHDAHVLMHGTGTVRSGKWKFSPWQEGKSKRDWSSRNKSNPRKMSEFPVQIYDTTTDIGKTINVAEANPEVVAGLQAAFDTQVVEPEANKRPVANLIRPEDSMTAECPGKPRNRGKSPVKKGKLREKESLRHRPSVKRQKSAPQSFPFLKRSIIMTSDSNPGRIIVFQIRFRCADRHASL